MITNDFFLFLKMIVKIASVNMKSGIMNVVFLAIPHRYID